jgi:long-chain fatty acid transport protein
MRDRRQAHAGHRARTLARAAPWAAGIGLALAAAGPLGAAGFELFAQGAKAAGMAGAFAAQADDPTALFYNPGGLALTEKKVSVGLVPGQLNESQVQGLSPGFAAGTTGEQEKSRAFPGHLYALKPLSPSLKLALGAYSPFAFKTSWADPGSFSGRPLSVASEVRTFDFAAGLAWRLSPNLGMGAAAVYRSSDFAQRRRLQLPDPLQDRRLVDVASVNLKTDMEGGIGWSAGILGRGKRLSWALAYRSPIGIDYAGVGRLTQVPSGNPQLDATVPATLPIGRDLAVETHLDFPGTATAALAWGSEKLLFEVDVNQTAWSGFQGIDVAAGEAVLDDRLQGPWEDALSYRAGVRIGPPKGPQWRAGVAFEETPQPEESVGPFLPDGARTVIATGFGLDWLDLAFQWETWADRTTFTNADRYNGTYRTSAYRLAITITK